jgi:DNA-binding NarL/FixJ family response regulator
VIKVAVVAATPAVRAGLRAMLSSSESVEVIAEAATLTDIQPIHPDTQVVVFADDSAVGTILLQNLEITEDVSVLWLVDQESDVETFGSELSTRSWGLLPIDSTVEELLVAVAALGEGMVVGSLAFMNRLLSFQPGVVGPGLGAAVEPLIEPLTHREIQVLELLAQGLANKQIAAALTISEHTVKFHISSIYTKLGAASRTEAVRLGVLQGLITL